MPHSISRGPPGRFRLPGLRHVAGAAVGVTLLACAAPAHADVSSWLFVGSGPGLLRRSGDTTLPLSLQLDAGMGSPPSGPVIVGGLARIQPYLGHGTDLSLLVRTTTHGFANGDWGGALDLGAYGRFWGTGSQGVTASLVLGAPWGITLDLGGSLGSNDQQSVSAVLGIDLARLTVYRQSGQSWWLNPFPVNRGPGDSVAFAR